MAAISWTLIHCLSELTIADAQEAAAKQIPAASIPEFPWVMKRTGIAGHAGYRNAQASTAATAA